MYLPRSIQYALLMIIGGCFLSMIATATGLSFTLINAFGYVLFAFGLYTLCLQATIQADLSWPHLGALWITLLVLALCLTPSPLLYIAGLLLSVTIMLMTLELMQTSRQS